MEIDNKKKERLRPTRHDILATFGFLLALVALAFSVWRGVDYFHTRPAKVDYSKYTVKGIDISSHNGKVDFDSVRAAGYTFVWIKASEGESFRDASFLRNHAAARKAGMLTGAYHYFRYDCDGVLQAMNLVQSLDSVSPDLGVAVDVEDEGNATGIPAENVRARLAAMLDYLSLKGYKVTLYSNKQGYYQYLQEDFADYPLWICSFSDYEPIDDGTQWAFWQHSHSGRVPGVSTRVDLNLARQ